MTQSLPGHVAGYRMNWYHDKQVRQLLPHLETIFDSASTGKCVFATYDYDRRWRPLSSDIRSVSFKLKQEPRSWLSGNRSRCVHRLIVVEDICVEAAHYLANVFDVSPEMFESHLAGAQPSREFKSLYTNQGPKDWCTRRLRRDFVSAKWLRPYQFNEKLDSISISNRSISHGDVSAWELQCNTWRMHVNLQGNGGNWSSLDGESSKLGPLSIIASEEKVTMWRGSHDGIDVIILLLDLGLNGPWERTKAPTAAKDESPLTEKRPSKRRQTASQQGNQPQDSSVIEGSSSGPVVRLAGGGQLAFRTDVGTDETVGDSMRSRNDIETLRNSQANHSVIPLDDPEQSGRLMKNLAIRAPCTQLTVKEAFQSGVLQPNTSTREDLTSWLQAWQSVHPKSPNFSNPMHAVQEIILRDVDDFLNVVHNYLDEIEGLADDELRLDQNILTWRQTLQYLRKELRKLHSSLENLGDYLYEGDNPNESSGSTSNPPQVRNLTSKVISAAEERLRATSQLLTNSMSIAEARRGITETESVTRLTELAFIYIPLSFAASFFGMQVKELNPETTSIGGFFGLAIAVTSASYCFRLVVRSEKLTSNKSRFMAHVRAEFGLRDDAPVRTRQVFRFIVQYVRDTLERNSFIIVTVLCLASLAAMIATWANSSLEGGIKIALASIYLIVGVSLGGLMLMAVTPLRSWPPYLQYSRTRTRRGSHQA